MPTATYTPLANLTLGSSAASVTFSSISQAYRDLVLVIAGTQSTGSNAIIRLNSDTGSNYPAVRMLGYNGSALSGSINEAYVYSGNLDQTAVSNIHLSILDYSATDKHHPYLVRNNVVASDPLFAQVMSVAGRWSNTAAITSISVGSSSGTYNTGTSFALYGIAA